jgi:hypothetical protein
MTLPMDNDTERFLHTLNIRAAQADRMSVGTLSMALRDNSLKDFIINLVCIQQLAAHQRCSLVAIR